MYADRIYIANDCIFLEDWTINDLMGKHRSRPYNPLIANTFFRAGFIEAWGRGIEKIKDSCKEAGNPMPEYTIKREDIMVMFKSLVSGTDQGTNPVSYTHLDVYKRQHFPLHPGYPHPAVGFRNRSWSRHNR